MNESFVGVYVFEGSLGVTTPYDSPMRARFDMATMSGVQPLGVARMYNSYQFELDPGVQHLLVDVTLRQDQPEGLKVIVRD